MTKTTEANVILLVEDNLTDVELTMHVLRKEKLADVVKVVRDGAEALEFLFGNDAEGHTNPLPKLILLDLKLPKVNGLEVLARIKADPRTKTVPVVVLTSSSEHWDLVIGYELGANSYVVKPVAFADFEVALRQLAFYWLRINEESPQRDVDASGKVPSEPAKPSSGRKGHAA
jgi:two-component system, response regulator